MNDQADYPKLKANYKQGPSCPVFREPDYGKAENSDGHANEDELETAPPVLNAGFCFHKGCAI